MASTVKIIGSEVTSGAASDISKAACVRVLNTTTGVVVLNVTTAGDVAVGSTTLAGSEVIYIKKATSEKLAAASNATTLKFTPIAFSN